MGPLLPTLIAWALAPSARACDEPADVLALSPENGAVGVPRGARVVLQVRGDDAVDPASMALYGETGLAPGSWRVEPLATGADALWTFIPDAPLDADAWYSLGVTEAPAYADESTGWNAGFLTSAVTHDTLAGAPELELVAVGQAMHGQGVRCEPERYRRVTWSARPVEVERPGESWVLLYLLGPEGDLLLEARRQDSRDWEPDAEVLVPTEADAFCLALEQRSASGNARRSEPACFDEPTADADGQTYRGGAGCAGVPGVPTPWAVLALLVVAARLRRAPTP